MQNLGQRIISNWQFGKRFYTRAVMTTVLQYVPTTKYSQANLELSSQKHSQSHWLYITTEGILKLHSFRDLILMHMYPMFSCIQSSPVHSKPVHEKMKQNYTFLYLTYIKARGILFRSTVFPRWFGSPVRQVNLGLKIIQPFLTWSIQ